MKRIESFCVNHDTLTPGMYLSRIDGDAVTYDVRMVTPNAGVYLENDGIHTFEHLFATYVRNTPESDRILYVGPMGCRTGFYFITRDTISRQRAIELVQETCAFIEGFEGTIPGSSRIECGNYLDHSLPKAKQYATSLALVLKDWNEGRMQYPLYPQTSYNKHDRSENRAVVFSFSFKLGTVTGPPDKRSANPPNRQSAP